MSKSTFPGSEKSSSGKNFPWRGNHHGALHQLEHIALMVEQPFNRLSGSLKLNPFYYTDTIAVFLWTIVALTGVYLTFFYQFGYEGSYNAVAKIESQFVAHTLRAVHRYASGTAIIVSLLHAYRTFFMDRFRGPRWLAWVSGIGMGLLLWWDGLTGYWMIWDQRAQVITETIISFLNRYFGSSGNRLFFSLLIAGQTDKSWLVMFLLLAIHILLFLIVALFFWYHIIRLNRPKLFPPQSWMIGTILVIILVSAFFPVGMLPNTVLNRMPGQIELDPFFLFFLPIELKGVSANLFWTGLLAVIVILFITPWIIRRRKPAPVKIDPDVCIGCTLCVADCPYNALEMVERNGKGSKLVAIAHPEKCVSCGICVGSCEGHGIEVDNLNGDVLWEATGLLLKNAKEKAPEESIKVVFACERHASHGARSYLESSPEVNGETEAGVPGKDARLVTIPLPCAGAVPPSLIGETYQAGASEVQLIGCPPEDCAHRRGNTWTEARLTRERKPSLKSMFKDAPISFDWQPPNLFKQAVEKSASNNQASLSWRNYVPVFGLLAVLFVVQVLFTNLPFTPYPEPQAKVQVIAPDLSKALHSRLPASYDGNIKLTLKVDGEIAAEQIYTPEDVFSYEPLAVLEEISVSPGDHFLVVEAANEKTGQIFWTPFIREVNLKDRDIFQITLSALKHHR